MDEGWKGVLSAIHGFDIRYVSNMEGREEEVFVEIMGVRERLANRTVFLFAGCVAEYRDQ